jgi:hypothetical protein
MRRQGSSKEKTKTDLFGCRTKENSPEARCSSIFAAPFPALNAAFLGYHPPMQVLRHLGVA